MSVRTIIISGLLFLLGAVMGTTQAWSQSTSPESVMTQNADGTWTVHKQVPLVGEGRVVNRLMSELVSVLPVGEQHLDYLVDEDLDNAASFGLGLVQVDLAMKQLVSIKDINRIYAKNQKVGLVFQYENELLDLELASPGFIFQFYKRGELVATVKAKDDENNVINLDLLSFSTGEGQSEAVIAVNAPKDFDEVAISHAALADVGLLKQPFRIKYFLLGKIRKYQLQMLMIENLSLKKLQWLKEEINGLMDGVI